MPGAPSCPQPGALLLGELELVEAAVDAVRGEELLVRAALAHDALVEHEDLLGVLDRREAVRDDDGRAARP